MGHFGRSAVGSAVGLFTLAVTLGGAGTVQLAAQPAGLSATQRFESAVDALDTLERERFERVVRPHLEAHCAQCHAGPEPKADLDLTAFARPSELAADEGLVLRLIERVERMEMPPLGPLPPAREDELRFTAALRQLLASSWSSELPSRPPSATLRRLDRFELRRVLFQLLGLQVAAERLPVDGFARGWTHAGDGQWLTELDVERWILLLEELSFLAIPDPHVATHEFDAEALRGGVRRNGLRGLSSSGWVRAVTGELLPGRYRLRVTVEADQAGPDPARIALLWGSRELARFELFAPDRTPETFTAELQVAAVEGGADELAVGFLNDYYEPDDEDPSERDRNLYVRGIALEGPIAELDTTVLADLGPESALAATLAGPPERAFLEARLLPFAERAWRGAAGARDDAAAVIDDALREPDTASALRVGVVGVLASPRFLFAGLPHAGDDPGGSRRLAPSELAARLTLFLHSRLPGDELARAARAGALATPAGLEHWARRLLRAPESSALVQRLADRWLGLAAFGEAAAAARIPAPLAASMRRETELLLEANLRERLPIETLLSADFTHVDAALAEHYGLPLLDPGPGARRVSLAGTGRRGLLGHAAILTLTSEATRTSAVRRGKWVLETLLNTPPPPPPPDVGSLESVRAAPDASLVERLALHRRAPACAGCHERMDRIGLDLEGFGPQGRRVPGSALDAARARIAELAAEPAAPHQPGLRRSAVEHLAELALARELTLEDRPWLARVLRRLERGPATLEQAILGIVSSEAFALR